MTDDKGDKDGDTALAICSPTHMGPAAIPGSVAHTGNCGHEVWISPAFQEKIDDPNFVVKCIPCVLSDSKLHAQLLKQGLSMLPTQREELNQKLGVAEVDQFMTRLNIVEREF